ncbi:hypothetical protein AAY473_024554 [Plecturocebus cupreus]
MESLSLGKGLYLSGFRENIAAKSDITWPKVSGGRLGLKAMRSVLGASSPEHTLCRLCCEYDQLPTALEHTRVGLTAGHAPSMGGTEHRSAVYSSTRHQHRCRGRQCRLTVILHQHQQAVARRVRFVQDTSRADLARVQPHAERDARAACRWLQLIRKPRIVARVRVHCAHLRHHVTCTHRPRHQLAHCAAGNTHSRRQQRRRVIVLVQHEHLQRHVAAQRRHTRVARAHLELQQLQLLVVQRLQRVHLAALRVHRHVARQRALAHPPLHQRVGHQRVLLRVRVPRRHREDVAARRVVLLHEHRVLGLRERWRVVVHVGHLHGHAGRGPQRRGAPVPRGHHQLIGRHALAVQGAVQHQRVVILEGGHQLEGDVGRQGAGHLSVGT